MVKAELAYNPYIQETVIRFNGKSPRINSHVEKYLDKKLQDWINELPAIFRDEMNGYGFELEFSGTKLDYEELRRAFADAGVSDSQVHIFHKNELSERADKLEKVEELLTWLEENPYNRYDFEAVRRKNYELFDGDYQYIILHGRVLDTSVFEAQHISIENVSSIAELDDTNLRNTPILYVVNQDSLGLMQRELRALDKREDVEQNQLFFRIRPGLKEDNIVREIIDLGITKPNVVQSADAPAIMRYFELYPFTDYIRDTVRLFSKQIPSIREGMEEIKSTTRVHNLNQRNQIDALDNELSNIKDALDAFNNPDKIDFSPSFIPLLEDLKGDIRAWRTKKTKITQVEEAVRVAGEFDRDLQDFYQSYLRKMHSVLVQTAKSIQIQQERWYARAQTDMGFRPEGIPMPDYSYDSFLSIKDELLKLKTEEYVVPKEDFLGMFFRQRADSSIEAELETTYYYAKWREYALSAIEPFICNIYNVCIYKLGEYFDLLGDAYKKHLMELLKEDEKEKEEVSSHLSKEERILQNDNDWLICFADMVKAIARD